MNIQTIPLMSLMALIAMAGLAGAGQTSDSLIVPGERIGQTHLGNDGAETLKHLPKPSGVDRGMSQTRQVWKSRPGGSFETLFIYTVNNGAMDVEPTDGVTIELIRVTAKYFRTANSISTGSTLEQIRKAFPDAVPLDDVPTIYDDLKQGIAFEFPKEPTAGSPCIAIMVHPPGESHVATQTQVASVLQEGNKD
ncbi:MAG: hypothetical protein JOZ08_12580 [Verrucomicrobia bacterium]|nr:hypothetical protein [Verrucomicrobiota bacterium]MBV8280204.1 hypothetical protein [Verrucomicrobiota bacterium]